MVLEDYKKISDLTVMQHLLREMLRDFHNICEENGLVYNVFGGTFLGAVRHGDIIPWDDDIDVTMPRPDYNRFIKIVEEKYADIYEIYAYPRKNYIYPYAKLCKKGTVLIENNLRERLGKLRLYLDIFPIDGAPDMPKTQMEKRFRKAERNKTLTCYCAEKITASPIWWRKPYAALKWLRRMALHMFGYAHFLKKQIQITEQFSYEECDMVGFASSWGYGIKGIIKKEDYLDRKLYPFGDFQVWGMADYDGCLRVWYGDYMTPPPEEKRCAPHCYDLFIKNN